MKVEENGGGRRAIRCYSVVGELLAWSTSMATPPNVFAAFSRHGTQLLLQTCHGQEVDAQISPIALISLSQPAPLLSLFLALPPSSCYADDFSSIAHS